MFFRQILHDDLGCASYVIADGGQSGRDRSQVGDEDYLALAQEQGLQITHILETHNHADHVSGRGRLHDATGATIHVSADAGVEYEHEPLADGEAVEFGQVRIVARATPGHRPEHTAYAVEDRSRGETPWRLLTGDSLFVGDVARPDLAVEPEKGARDLYRSLRSLDRLDDYVEVWPGHICGSLCGGAGMSETPGSTLGFERRFNRFLKIDNANEFVRELTRDLAPQPPNFKRIVELNRSPLLTETAQLDAVTPARLQQLLEEGATLIDGREPREFDAAHIPGSINVTMVKAAVGTRAAWVVEPNTEVVVTAAGELDAKRLALMLEAVGFRQLRGYLAGGISAWQAADLPTSATEAIEVATLAERLKAEEVVLLDVREQDEWEDGHLEGSLHLPFHELRDGVPAELRAAAAQKPLAVACSAGNRSSLAASLLRRHGVHAVQHVTGGGVEDLTEHGIELTEEEER